MNTSTVSSSVETPPRAWGIRSSTQATGTSHRNTPTGVGNTAPALPALLAQKKHPHGRGEYQIKNACLHLREETPPRAWGIPARTRRGRRGERNTPTGVGNTPHQAVFLPFDEKHPHGRGEYYCQLYHLRHSRETPPRAWGIRAIRANGVTAMGNTPTGVGNTPFVYHAILQI